MWFSASLLVFTTVLSTSALAANCSYLNMVEDYSYDGPCDESEIQSRQSDVYAWDVIIDKKKIRVTVGSRQGGWAHATLNGRAAIRYTHSRCEFSYGSLDLLEFLDIESC